MIAFPDLDGKLDGASASRSQRKEAAGSTCGPARLAFQLTLDGREVLHGAPTPHRPRPLTDMQADVLKFAELHRNGWLRPAEVGRLVHGHRAHKLGQSSACGYGAKGGRLSERAVACCVYAASDGNEVLKALERRGLVEHLGRGAWSLTSHV